MVWVLQVTQLSPPLGEVTVMVPNAILKGTSDTSKVVGVPASLTFIKQLLLTALGTVQVYEPVFEVEAIMVVQVLPPLVLYSNFTKLPV